jgi:hypothetical protein
MNPIDLVINRLKSHGCNPRESGTGQWKSRCPAHEGKSSNLSVKEDENGKVLLHCHHAENGAETCSAEAIVGALGLEMTDLFPPKPDATPTRKPRKTTPKKDRNGVVYRSAEDATAALAKHLGKPTGQFQYVEPGGFELMRVLRFDPPGTDKEFRPLYPDAAGWHIGDPAGKLPLYHLDTLAAAEIVYVTEGEGCADLVRELGVTATTSSHGASGAAKTDWSPLVGKTVRLIPDHDKAGEGYINDVGAILKGLGVQARVIRLPVTGDGHDAREWLDEIVPDSWGPDECRAELERLAVAAPEWSPVNATPKLVVRADAVESREVKWLWPDRVPYQFITIFAGPTGVGKSFVALDIAARKSTGDRLPDSDGERCTVGNVLVISEDSHEFILRPRLEALGADLTRVFFMTWEAMASYELKDIDTLNRLVQDAGDPDLIIIDPPTNFLGGVDECRNSEVRGVLMKLVMWLTTRSKLVALILITQVSKAGREVAAINRIIGSIAWAATSRIAHTFSADKDEPGVALFACPKDNLGPIPKTLRYRIVPQGKQAFVQWAGESDKTADEAMNGKPKKRAESAADFLIASFRKQLEWPSEELFKQGRKKGISRNAIFEAKADLELPKACKRDDEWFWWVPADWPLLKTEEPSQASVPTN